MKKQGQTVFGKALKKAAQKKIVATAASKFVPVLNVETTGIDVYAAFQYVCWNYTKTYVDLSYGIYKTYKMQAGKWYPVTVNKASIGIRGGK